MTPAEVKFLRLTAGLTQKQAAELVGSTERAWRSWEDETPHGRAIPEMAVELFRLKTAKRKVLWP